MEDVDLKPDDSAGLETAINHIKKVSYLISDTDQYPCNATNGCLEKVRELVMQIKMAEWGLFGLGEVSVLSFFTFI